jgi:hypothetical protein
VGVRVSTLALVCDRPTAEWDVLDTVTVSLHASFRRRSNAALNFLSDLACWSCVSAIRSACTFAIMTLLTMSCNVDPVLLLLPFYTMIFSGLTYHRAKSFPDNSLRADTLPLPHQPHY